MEVAELRHDLRLNRLSKRSSLSSTRRDQLTKLGVDAHRLLAVIPTVLVERLALDVFVSSSVAVVSAITDWENSMPKFRAPPELCMSPRTQLEKDAVCFDDG